MQVFALREWGDGTVQRRHELMVGMPLRALALVWSVGVLGATAAAGPRERAVATASAGEGHSEAATRVPTPGGKLGHDARFTGERFHTKPLRAKRMSR